MSLVAYISAPLALSLLGGPLFLRFLVVFSGVVLIFWISSFFHGFRAVLAFLCFVVARAAFQFSSHPLPSTKFRPVIWKWNRRLRLDPRVRFGLPRFARVTHGLYELKAKTGISVATLVPVNGTLTTHERGGVLPDETFDRLWGTDGDELVAQRYRDGWGISWTKVVASPPTSD